MIQGRRSKRGDQEPATRPIYLNFLELASVSWVRRPSGFTCSTPGVRPANGPAESIVRACGAYVAGRRATVNRERTVAFDEDRLAIVKDRIGDVLLSTITREMIEGFQAKRKLDGVSNRTVNMDVGTLRKVLKRYGHWRRLQDHVTMLSEAEGAPIGRALTNDEQKRLLETAASNPEWEHVYCAAVLAANTSMRASR
jgi:hypothetical protein